MKQQGIDSPLVRDALAVGDIRQVNSLTGKIYCVNAMVVHGNHLGRTLGYPTANLAMLKNNPFLLANGVYAVTVEVDQLVYKGMANAGVRPTISGNTLTVEVNLFDFIGDLYGKTLAVCFIDRIRDEKKFDSLNHLVQQIHLDKKMALYLLARL
jgi:riboflavin kinase/FMN adenylyltransferase